MYSVGVTSQPYLKIDSCVKKCEQFEKEVKLDTVRHFCVYIPLGVEPHKY